MNDTALVRMPTISGKFAEQGNGAPVSLRRGMLIPHTNASWQIVNGWAAQQTRALRGTRRIVSLILPGDLIPAASARYMVVALTDVEIGPVGGARGYKAFDLHDAARGRLIDHAARLAGYEAYERLADLLLELYGRLRAAGLATGRRFPIPIGQHVLGNMLGMSEVHVNRMIAKLRADGHLLTGPGWYALPDPDALRFHIDGERNAA